MPPRRRSRAVTAAVASLAALILASGCTSAGSSAQAAAPPEPLRILVVNDDGWRAPGIVTLREALRAAGHRVVQIAPVDDRGSAGTATTMRGEIVVRRPTPDPDLYTVSGTPADAVLIAVRAVMGDEWPDVVIAGINSRPSVGVTAMQSGTIGAAMTAAGADFAALAVSADVENPARPSNTDFDRPAEFTVRLLDELVRQRPEGARLLPQRTVLNVNYPRGPEPPRGVTAAPTADVPTATVSYRYGRDLERYIPVPTETPPSGAESDATVLASGRITLTDLSADLDRSTPPPRVAARVAPAMEP